MSYVCFLSRERVRKMHPHFHSIRNTFIMRFQKMELETGTHRIFGTRTLRRILCAIFGSVLIWHSYKPASLGWTYLICNIHESPGGAAYITSLQIKLIKIWILLIINLQSCSYTLVLTITWNLSSAMNVYRSTVTICESSLRIHETYKKPEQNE